MEKNLQLYIHIPFCIKKCTYCTALVKTGTSTAKALYLEALERELETAIPFLKEYAITSIYLGGGSPSTLNPDAVAKMIGKLKNSVSLAPHAETCIEMMPQTIGTPSLSGLRMAGFTRVSLSMQSSNDKELEALDCGFKLSDVQNAVLFLDKFGMRNINIDLMYGNPLQTNGSWKKTLDMANGFSPEHISIYPFSSGADKLDRHPSAEEQENTHAFAREYLEAHGYHQYSLYHFAKPHHASRYFSDRFAGCDYMGFGLGAKSFIDGISYENTSDYALYLEHSAEFETIACNITRLDENQLEERRSLCKAIIVR